MEAAMIIIGVDDERLSRENLEEAIRAAAPEAEVVMFRSAENALGYAESHPVDVAFLDIEMRGMNGVNLARKLRLINKRINVIFTTGYSIYQGEAFKLHASGYIMKPVTKDAVKMEMDDLRHPVDHSANDGKRIRIQTFGNFEVFLDGQPLRFHYAKTKEMLAYLTDRRGALCSNGEIAAILWDDDDSDGHQSYLKNLKSDMMEVLTHNGAEGIIVRQRGKVGILPTAVSCDFYDWLAGKPYAINAYLGEYMMQYSWAETTHAGLDTGLLQL